MEYAQAIKKINDEIKSRALLNDHSRNFIHLIRPYENLKVNIVGDFSEALEAESFSQPYFCVASKKSFGVAPEIQFDDIKQALEKGVFSSEKEFTRYVADNSLKYFCIDIGEFNRIDTIYNIDDLKRALFARCVLSATSCYEKRQDENGNEKYVSINPAIYSGVIPRLYRLEYKQPEDSNINVGKIILYLGRTSYLTMYGLGDFKVLNHPYIKNNQIFREINEWFDNLEVRNISEYIETIKESMSIGDEVQALNNYLQKSLSIHNVNVSGNLITSDNYCLFTERNKKVVDANTFYCSVNGGSEIYDKKVSFYSNSLEEDIPTINYSSKQFYFGGELTREAIAELGITDSSTYWNYYGISVMAGKENIEGHRTWLHFNILGYKQCADSFDSIVEKSKNSTEAFENAAIFGYKQLVFKDKKSMWLERIKKLIQWLWSQKDIIIIFITFLIAGCASDFETRLNWILAIVYLVVQTVSFAIYFINGINKEDFYVIDLNKDENSLFLYEKVLRKISFWSGKRLFRHLNKKAKNSAEKADPIFMLLTMLRTMENYEL